MRECCTQSDASTPALLLIDIQEGFHDPVWGIRNNLAFESNIRKLLHSWRSKRWPIIHVQHLSTSAQSPLRPGEDGARFMDVATPFPSEPIFTKQVNSAFIGTELHRHLQDLHLHRLVIAGLTTDHCVSTTVRMAANLGYEVIVPTDATATFERTGPSGQTYLADVVHELALASLKDEFAGLNSTDELLRNQFAFTKS